MSAVVSSSSEGAAAVQATAGYLASEPHYLSVAGRILAALGGTADVADVSVYRVYTNVQPLDAMRPPPS